MIHYRMHRLPRARRVMLARSASLLGAGRRNMHAENAAFNCRQRFRKAWFERNLHDAIVT